MYTCVCVYVSLYVYMCVSMRARVYMHMYHYRCVRMRICKRARGSICICEYTRMYTSIFVRMCVFLSVCIWVCVSVCMYT
jgi:hypothetical protein